MSEIQIIEVTKDNIIKYPPKCFLNPKNVGYQKKLTWLENRFNEGLKIVQLYLEGKLIGFIEYVPGEYAWRAVDAKDYLFIHCIWTTPKKLHNKGYGSLLINECIKDAEKQNKNGVAVITSTGPFMADPSIFEKNDFVTIEESKPYSLLIKKLKDGKEPTINDYKEQLEKYKGLHIVYSNQCPWVSRFISEMQKRFNTLDIQITELTSAKEAQNAPSIYAAFNLIYNGKLYVDHYISERRFENILKKEMKLDV